MEAMSAAPANPDALHLLEIHVSTASQRLDLVSKGDIIRSWPVSTSKYGVGTEPGSFKTPLGRFQIAEAYGAGEPLWAVFKARVPTGEIAVPGGETDGILTRILWIEGLDPENQNTRSRYIYFHGTNQEHLIGQPASHGCIRLRNADMAELFSLVRPGTPVVIV